MLSPMRRLGQLLTLIAMLTLARVAGADGKVFTHAAPAEIPSQSALIVYDGKVQTLAIETRFVAEGKDFAWVVPLPAVPEIEPGTPGMFASLRAMFLPDLITSRNTPVALALVLLMLLVLGIWGTLLGAGSRWRIILYLAALVAFLGFGFLLPALGSARGIDPRSEVSVLDRKIVGEFETTTLRSSDDASLVVWLSEHGFALPPEARDVVRGYTADGWVFVAVKLRREFQEADLTAPTPLVFRFPTRSCVYPMRLTGAKATVPLDVELYVFADKAASAPGFASIRHSEMVLASDPQVQSDVKPSAIVVSHRRVRELVGHATHATLLRSTLQPSQMITDVPVSFAMRSLHGSTAIGTSITRPIAGGVGLIVAGAVGIYFLLRKQRPVAISKSLRLVGWSAAAGVLGGMVVMFILPSVPETNRGWRQSYLVTYLARALDTVTEQAASDLDEAQIGALVLEAVRADHPNFVLPRYEDSPGNFTIRRIDRGFELVLYSWRGEEYTFPLIR